MRQPFLINFPPKKRSVVGKRLSQAVRGGATTPEAVIEEVRVAALARDSDLDGGIVRDLARHSEDAHAYAEFMLRPPEERAALEREENKFYIMRAQSRKPASERQRNFLLALGDSAPVSNAWDASQRIEARRSPRPPILCPPPPPGGAHFPVKRRADPTRPTALPVIFVAVPADLRERPQWLCWRHEKKGERWTKIPYNPRAGRYASSTDSNTWGSFDDAVAACQRGDYDGIGFVFSAEDDFAGVDLDHVRNPLDGTLTAEAAALVREFATYTEISPSQTGLKLIMRGKLPSTGRKAGDYEVYDKGRFFALTGHLLPGGSQTVEARQGVLDAFSRRVFRPEPAPPIQATQSDRVTPPAPRPPRPTRPSGDTLATPIRGGPILAEVGPLLSERMQRLAEGDDSVVKRDGTPYASESERIEAFLCACFRIGLSDEEAKAACLATPRGQISVTKRMTSARDLDAWLDRSCQEGRAWLDAQTGGTRLTGGRGGAGARYIALDAAFLTHAAALGPNGLAVAIALASHAPHIYPTQRRLATLLELSPPTIIKYLDSLRALHLVGIKTDGGGRTRYRLHATEAPPVCIPWEVWERTRVLGADSLAIVTLVIAGTDTQAKLAQQLAISRERVNNKVGRLVATNVLRVAAVEAHNQKRYALSPQL